MKGVGGWWEFLWIGLKLPTHVEQEELQVSQGSDFGHFPGLDLLWIPGPVLLFALTVVVVLGVFDLAGFPGWTAGFGEPLSCSLAPQSGD